MSTWKKALSVGASAAMLASLLATTAVGTALAANGSVYPYTSSPSGSLAANGTAYFTLSGFNAGAVPQAPQCNAAYDGTNAGTLGAAPCAVTVLNIQVTGGQFINGLGAFSPTATAPGLGYSYPRTQIFITGTDVFTAFPASALWLASTTAGTATVTAWITFSNTIVAHPWTNTVPDSSASFTFTSATVNVPSTALSSTDLCMAGTAPCTNKVSSPASAPTTSNNTNIYMVAQVKDNYGNPVTGASVEFSISGPAFFDTAGIQTGAGTFKETVTPDANGFAATDDIFGTGSGGAATIATVIKYLGVSYTLSTKTINFVGDPATITAVNNYYSQGVSTCSTAALGGTCNDLIDLNSGDSSGAEAGGALEANVKDAAGNDLTLNGSVSFQIQNPTPAAYWTITNQAWDSADKAWALQVTCGPTAGTSSAQIQATVASGFFTTTSQVVTTTPITYTCADPLSSTHVGTLSVDTSGGTTVQPGGQLALKATVLDDNGLPAVDGSFAGGTIITGVTNGFGAVVKASTGLNQKGSVNGVSNFIYLAPSTAGTGVVTFFGGGYTTPLNVPVTVTVGQGASTGGTWGASVKAGAPSEGGTYGTATPVVKPGTYISWKLAVGGTYASKTVYVWVNKKSASGAWGTWTLLTSRITDNAGVAIFNWRVSSDGWYSVQWSASATDRTTSSAARQGRWMS